ncbi:MAG TPA: alpha/beta fold hydrolase [Ktedonobacterales bacterium]|nr:alpha/beta fold hydrolase [Ktedonobacterales bacterium]
MSASENTIEHLARQRMSADGAIHYERSGQGEPLLLLHGIGSSLRIWDPVLPMLTSHYDVIAVDLPGHGDSPILNDDTSPDAAGFARALAGFMDELGIETETAHLAGNSLGGWTALELAKLGRARSVVCLSPAGLWRGRAPVYDIVLFRVSRWLARTLLPVAPTVLASPIGRTLVLAHLIGRPWSLPPSAALEAVRTFVRTPGFEPTFRATTRESFAGGRQIDVPVTVAWGGRDRVLLPGLARFHDELPPPTRWLTLPGCGHVPTYDAPALVARTILSGTHPAWAGGEEDHAMPVVRQR